MNLDELKQQNVNNFYVFTKDYRKSSHAKENEKK
jgi:hypothetical protein